MGRALLAIILAFTLVIAGCGDDDDGSAGQKRTLRVGLSFPPGVDDAGERVAYERLERETGIRAKFTQTGGPPNTVAALLRGDVDIGSTALRGTMSAIDEGADLKVVLGSAMVTDFFLVAADEITNVRDLAGKRIAYGEPGGSTEVVTKVALERAGVAEGDVKFSVVDDAQRRAAALVGGKVDAIALEYPDAQLLLARQPGLHTVASLYEIAPFLIAQTYVVKGDLLERDPELVREAVGGLLEGYEFLRTPEGRRAWFAEAREAAGGEEEQILEDVYERHKRIGYWPRRDQPVTEQQSDRISRFWVKEGLLETALPFAKVWDVSAWEAAG